MGWIKEAYAKLDKFDDWFREGCSKDMISWQNIHKIKQCSISLLSGVKLLKTPSYI